MRFALGRHRFVKLGALTNRSSRRRSAARLNSGVRPLRAGFAAAISQRTFSRSPVIVSRLRDFAAARQTSTRQFCISRVLAALSLRFEGSLVSPLALVGSSGCLVRAFSLGPLYPAAPSGCALAAALHALRATSGRIGACASRAGVKASPSLAP